MTKQKRVYKPRPPKMEPDLNFLRERKEELDFLLCCSPEQLVEKIATHGIKSYTVHELLVEMRKDGAEFYQNHKDEERSDGVNQAILDSAIKIELLKLLIKGENEYLQNKNI
jgi:hypothetical protein